MTNPSRMMWQAGGYLEMSPLVSATYWALLRHCVGALFHKFRNLLRRPRINCRCSFKLLICLLFCYICLLGFIVSFLFATRTLYRKALESLWATNTATTIDWWRNPACFQLHWVLFRLLWQSKHTVFIVL